MNLHSRSNPFLAEKMVKNGYYGNKGFGLAWDRIKVRQIGPFTTTTMVFCHKIFDDSHIKEGKIKITKQNKIAFNGTYIENQ